MRQEANSSTAKSFYETLPELPMVAPVDDEIARLPYDLEWEASSNIFLLVGCPPVYMAFLPAVERIATAEPGEREDLSKYSSKSWMNDERIIPLVRRWLRWLRRNVTGAMTLIEPFAGGEIVSLTGEI